MATVSTTGLVTVVTFGHADITATFQSVSGKTTIALQLNLTGSGQASTTTITLAYSGTNSCVGSVTNGAVALVKQ